MDKKCPEISMYHFVSLHYGKNYLGSLCKNFPLFCQPVFWSANFTRDPKLNMEPVSQIIPFVCRISEQKHNTRQKRQMTFVKLLIIKLILIIIIIMTMNTMCKI